MTAGGVATLAAFSALTVAIIGVALEYLTDLDERPIARWAVGSAVAALLIAALTFSTMAPAG